MGHREQKIGSGNALLANSKWLLNIVASIALLLRLICLLYSHWYHFFGASLSLGFLRCRRCHVAVRRNVHVFCVMLMYAYMTAPLSFTRPFSRPLWGKTVGGHAPRWLLYGATENRGKKKKERWCLQAIWPLLIRPLCPRWHSTARIACRLECFARPDRHRYLRCSHTLTHK